MAATTKEDIKKFDFQREWHDPDFNWTGLQSVYVAPVNTDYIQQMTWWQKASFAGKKEIQQAKPKLAAYMRQQFIDAFRNDHNNRFRVVDNPGSDTLIIQSAITELVPNKAWLDTLEMATLLMTFSKGKIAFESRMQQGPNGDVIATIADSRTGKADLLNVKDFTWWGWAKDDMQIWAKQVEEVVNGGWQNRVKHPFPVTLKVW